MREGFEPSKAEPPDLQSGPFDRSGTSPLSPLSKLLAWSWRWDSNPRPADYKSAALPAELRQLNVRNSNSRGEMTKQEPSQTSEQARFLPIRYTKLLNE